MSDLDMTTLWMSLISELHNSPPKQKSSAFKKLTKSHTDESIFKGRQLVDWLKSFLLQRNIVEEDVSPEHAFRLASTLLDHGAISPDTKKGTAPPTYKKAPFSLRSKYSLTDEKDILSVITTTEISSDEEDNISISSSKSMPTGPLKKNVDHDAKRRSSCTIATSLSFLKEKSVCPVSKTLSSSINSKLKSKEIKPVDSCSVAKMQAFKELSTEVNALPTTALKIGDKVTDFQLPNQKGKLKRLGDLLKKGPLIINFVIGGDCPKCVKELSIYNELVDYIELADAHLVTISPETKEELTKTSKLVNMKTTYLSDVGFNVHQEFGSCYNTSLLSRKSLEFCRSFFPGTAAHFGYFEAELPPLFPYRGTFIVDQEFTVRFSHISLDERAEPAELIGILKEIKAETAELKRSSSSGKSNVLFNRNSKSSGSSSALSSSGSIRSRHSTASSKSEASLHATSSTASVMSVESITQMAGGQNNIIIGSLLVFNMFLLIFYFLFM